MSSWTTQELSLPAAVDGVVSRNFLVRDPQYLVVEITGVPDGATSATVTIEDSSDGVFFSEVVSGGDHVVVTIPDEDPATTNDSRVLFRFDASVETTAKPLRNICRVKLNGTATFSKVYVTWSP